MQPVNDYTTAVGTITGTVLSVGYKIANDAKPIIDLSWHDIVNTAILAIIGAVFGFFTSSLMKKVLKRF